MYTHYLVNENIEVRRVATCT